jgi:tetratricopeptide (TPR) repeat protein
MKMNVAKTITKDMQIKHIALLLLVILTSCSSNCHKMEPCIEISVHKNDISRLPSAFEPLSPSELQTDWGKELRIAQYFAKDNDLYRAITSFKRALLLMPEEVSIRTLQAEFGIIESYWYGKKYYDAIAEFEDSDLILVTPEFPAFRDLIVIMHDCYDKTEQFEKAEQLLKIIETNDSELANDIQISIALREGDLESAVAMADLSDKRRDAIYELQQDYYCHAKSIKKAEMLNALLPGAGYAYVGQTRAGITSFIINGLFIWATCRFFDQGNYAAGLLTLSLETGWYFGGINGAGIAAKEYNEAYYNNITKGTMMRNNLFPIFMLETSF